MENVYLYVAVAAFVAAAILAIAAVVIFVRMDVLNAIRFLQGKRVPVKSGGARAGSSSRNARARVGRAKAQGRAAGVPQNTDIADDRVTDVPPATPADDSATTVVGAAEISMPHGDDAPTTVVGAAGLVNAIEREEAEALTAAEVVEGMAGSETPTEALSEDMDEESERPTGMLMAEDEEESERPTGMLVAEDDESERPTGVLGPEEDEDSERPTGVLETEDDDSELPTALLVEDDEESERATGMLAQDEDGSEQPTGILADVAEDVSEHESAEGQSVVQQEDDGFRFILKQNVIVVHTDETI